MMKLLFYTLLFTRRCIIYITMVLSIDYYKKHYLKKTNFDLSTKAKSMN